MQARKLSEQGKSSGTVELNDRLFGKELNLHVLHMAVLRELANRRAGTACAKTRSEVRGGGKALAARVPVVSVLRCGEAAV
jgi:large subunit ribosomal protein L4